MVGPVKLDFLALVRNGVDPFLVTTERNEVALVVVAAKKTVQVVVDLVLQGRDIHRFLGQSRPEFFDLWSLLRVHAGDFDALNDLI